jgi:hypothetical protein
VGYLDHLPQNRGLIAEGLLGSLFHNEVLKRRVCLRTRVVCMILWSFCQRMGCSNLPLKPAKDFSIFRGVKTFKDKLGDCRWFELEKDRTGGRII